MSSPSFRIAQFVRDERGATAMTFALMIIPLTAMLGFAVDGALVPGATGYL